MRALLILLFWVSFVIDANEVTVKSPNKQLSLTFTDTNNIAQYRIDFEGKPVLGEGKLGFTFAEAAPMYRDFTVKEVSRNSTDNTWAQPWGEQTLIRDHHNELLVQFVSKTDPQNTFLVRARVFYDCVGFRYEVPSQDKRVITRELTEFNFVDSHKATAYWIPAHGRERYEYLYRTTPLQEVYKAHTPFTVEYDNGVHVAIHEAALVDYSADDWFVGAITDENAIDLTIPLDFLDKDKKYEAQIYVDGKDAHWETNPYALTIEHKKVTATDTLSLHLAASGGAAVRFKALP